uniref:Uncharacterized protein n=1 Tax=Corethron hystrix TaxID=216773 RepID=A0A7S1B2T7_9STRA|mmetsp:Transcript_10522/g.23221  ORF Transcript_10522/g.23221 Transcript_10522/m.23221 type:complete len:341 (+) Transcript_10522:32-1054(+)
MEDITSSVLLKRPLPDGSSGPPDGTEEEEEEMILFDSRALPSCAGISYVLQSPNGDECILQSPDSCKIRNTNDAIAADAEFRSQMKLHRCVVTTREIRLLAVPPEGEDDADVPAAVAAEIASLTLHAVVHPRLEEEKGDDDDEDDGGPACIYCQLEYVPTLHGGGGGASTTHLGEEEADRPEADGEGEEKEGVIWTRPEEEDYEDEDDVQQSFPWELRLFVHHTCEVDGDGDGNGDGNAGKGTVSILLQELFESISQAVAMNPDDDDDDGNFEEVQEDGIPMGGWICGADFDGGEMYENFGEASEDGADPAEREAMLARLDALTVVSPEVEAYHAAKKQR